MANANLPRHLGLTEVKLGHKEMESTREFHLTKLHISHIHKGMQPDRIVSVEFVWTKFGVEAGESISDIVARKEKERLANGGVFLWGIGNNVGPSIRVLAEGREPEAIFSPISSPPRTVDVNPSEVVRWTEAETLDGEPFVLPRGSVVTSRGGLKKRIHYALVCYSERPIEIAGECGQLFAGTLRNLVSGRQVGYSQVTSVVRSLDSQERGRSYPISMRIKLVPPFFVKLLSPIPVRSRGAASLVHSVIS